MDVSTLMKLALSAASTQAISKNTTASSDQVSQVISAVLPTLLRGASAQATNQKTAESFAKAAAVHSTANTQDLSKFLGAVDTADGAKIVQHLLGGNTATTTKAAAKTTGASEADVAKIMATVAPLMMSVIGQQNAKHSDGSSALIQALMSGALGAAQQSKKSGIDAADVIGLLGKIIK